MNASEKRVLVMGASGRFGQAAVRAFSQAGWTVFAQGRPMGNGTLKSNAANPRREDGAIFPIRIAPDQVEELRGAVGRVDWVVHALNPTYADWERLALPLLNHSIDLAQGWGARLMLPGNVYNFGSTMPAVLTETTEQQPDTCKGRVRLAMEQRLQLAARESGLHSVVLRAGDFFGSGRGSWFDLLVAKGLRKGVLSYPDAWDIKTPWAYLPDLAQATVLLAEKDLMDRQALARFEVLHFKGYELSGEDWAELLTPIARQNAWLAEGKYFKRRSIPWTLMRLIAPWARMPREILEMRYLWNRVHALDNQVLRAALGEEPHTDLRLAVEQTLQDWGWSPVMT